jgi:predicted ester cyclase
MSRVPIWMAAGLALLTIGDAVRARTAALAADDNRSVVRRHYAAVNRGDAKAAAGEFAPEALNYGEALPRDARTFFQTGLEDILQTFPDWHATVVDLVADGDSVVALSRVTGTHLGVGHLPLNGGLLVDVQPTGRKIDVAHIHWFKVRGGQIVDHYVARDDVGMYKQLGILQNATVSETSIRLAASEPIAPTPEGGSAETVARNTAAVREFFARENARDTTHLNPQVQVGFADIIRTFPDWQWNVVDTIGQGDSVVALVRARGTHRGVSQLPLNGALLVGVQPTGEHFDVWHIHWFKLADGRITADYRTRDDIGLYKQLGILGK